MHAVSHVFTLHERVDAIELQISAQRKPSRLPRYCRAWLCVLFVAGSPAASLRADDWTGFRGPTGQGKSNEKGAPVKWSAAENVAWKAELPGPGSSSPIVIGDRVFVTCYSGYGLEPAQGDPQNLKRHILCFDRATGNVLWKKEFPASLPEHRYEGEGSYQGYAGNTPLTDGERLYVFFGKSGVFCFDLEGNDLWQTSVGDGVHGWGSGSSPVLHGDRLIVNASVESGSLVALEKRTGKEVWRAQGINSAWNTPLVVGPKGNEELVISIQDFLVGFDATSGSELWRAEGVHRYVCPSVVTDGEVLFAIGGGHTSLAVRRGGRGDVSKSNTVWRENKGSNVGSPILDDGRLYWVSDNGGVVCCQNAATGETLYQERLSPDAGTIWSSPVLADGKLYIVSQHGGTYVVAAGAKFEQLAYNVIEEDQSRANASPAVSQGRIYLRTDRFLYCIGGK